jgi:hypothetical protein
MKSALVLRTRPGARSGNPGEFFLRSKAPLLIHRWPLQFSEGSVTGSATLALDKAELISFRMSTAVADCCTSPNDNAKEAALLRFSKNCLTKYTALLHVKHDGAGKRISGYGTRSVIVKREDAQVRWLCTPCILLPHLLSRIRWRSSRGYVRQVRVTRT